MRYATEFLIGLFIAVVWSGGWILRGARLVIAIGALAPAFGFEQGPKAMLSYFTGIPSSEIPNWWIYVIGAGAICLVLAFRVALLETRRITIERIRIDPPKNKKHLLIDLYNGSFRGAKGLKLSLVSCSKDSGFIGNDTSLPIILSTQQRLMRQRSGIQPVPQRRFDLPAWDRKSVEVFWTQNGTTGLIEHENGSCEIRIFEEPEFSFILNGAGQNIEFDIRLVYGGDDKWHPFLLRDTLDSLALGQFDLREWF